MANLTPDEILQIHKDYADEFADLAQSGLTGAFSALSASGIFNYHPSTFSFAFPNYGTPDKDVDLPQRPIEPTLPDVPELDNTLAVPNPSFGSPPNPSYGGAPVYNAPPKPAEGVPGFYEVAPATPATPVMPDVPPYLQLPDYTLPYTEINVPDAPVITMPVFEGQRPDNIQVPDAASIVQQYEDEQNNHRTMLPAYVRENADAMLTQFVPEYHTLRARINNAITSYTDPVNGGGIGTPEQIENAIYARASDRTSKEFNAALATATETIAKRGYKLPPGALYGAVRKARTDMGDALVRSSTEIAVKNVELEQANFQFMLKLGAQLEEKMLDTLTQYMNLSLQMDNLAIQSAKEIVAAYIGAYNLQVMVFKAMMDGYVADTQVYRAKIEALEATVRLYEAEIKAELAKTEVNNAYVKVIQAVADVNQSLANSYRVQVEAALAPLEVARTQVAIYEAKARAYTAQVQAYEARWNAYRAEVDGELGKFKGYEASVNGYVAQAQGYKAKVEGYAAQVSATAETNRAIGATNESRIKVYSAQAETAIKNFESLIAAYTAESNAAIAQTQIEIEYWRTQSNLLFQEFNVAVNQAFEYAREQMNLFRGQMEAAINAANGLAQAAAVAGNLAGGAMQGLTSFAGRLVSSEE